MFLLSDSDGLSAHQDTLLSCPPADSLKFSRLSLGFVLSSAPSWPHSLLFSGPLSQTPLWPSCLQLLPTSLVSHQFPVDLPYTDCLLKILPPTTSNPASSRMYGTLPGSFSSKLEPSQSFYGRKGPSMSWASPLTRVFRMLTEPVMESQKTFINSSLPLGL